MRFRFTWLAFLFVSICVAAQTEGTITGTVVDETGKPIPGAKVRIAEKKPFYGSRVLHYYDTNIEGKFLINHVAWGTYVVMAGKESEGYADTTGAFYSNLDVPTVDLGPLFPTANVTVRLGPRAGILHIESVTDAVTGKKIQNAGITLRRVDNLKFFVSTSTSVEKILVPSTTAVAIEIESEGYKPWPPPDRAEQPGKIKLEPDQVFNLEVSLQPVSDPTAEIIRIVHRTLYDHRMEISHGTTLTSPILPSREDVERLRQLDGQGVDLLSVYLKDSANILDQQAILCLLSNIGGEQALDLLAEFAEKAKSPVVRSRVLEWLAGDHRPKDRLLIQQISVGDMDAEVRETAIRLLQKQ